jgi:pimeloyl-ACP methyl ester carboxylesterase
MPSRLVPFLITALACAHAQSATTTTAPPGAFQPTAFAVKVSGEGTPVVFIPGLATGGEVWDATLKHLGGKVQAHVITIAGFAGQPPVKTEQPLLTEVRVELARYLRERHLKAVIVGHSLGAMLAWWLAITDPDVVASVVAIDAPPYGIALENPDVTGAQFEPKAKQISEGMRGASKADLEQDARGRFTHMIADPKEVDHYVAAAIKSSQGSLADALYQLFSVDLREDAKKIAAPVLVIIAKLDVPDDHWADYEKLWHAQIDGVPDHQVVVVEKSHHYVMLDAPDDFYKALDGFLAAHH